MDELQRPFREKGGAHYTSELEHRRALKDEAEKVAQDVTAQLKKSIDDYVPWDGEEEGDRFPFVTTVPFSDDCSLNIREGLSDHDMAAFLYEAFCYRDGLRDDLPEPIDEISLDRGAVASLLDFPTDHEINISIAIATGSALASRKTLVVFEHCGISIDVPKDATPKDILKLYKAEAAEVLRMRDFRHGNAGGIGVIESTDEPDGLS